MSWSSGGGLTGLVTATVLGRAGLGSIVLERHGIGGVTTRGSTGKLTALQGGRSSAISAERGTEAAQQYAAASTFGVRALCELITELGIDCALTTAPDHTFATGPEGAQRCAEELDAATVAGLAVEWVSDSDLPLDILGAVRLADQAHLDPGALCAGLAARLGHAVFDGCVVTAIDEQDQRVVVSFDGGEVTADHVVVATLGPIHDPAMLSTRCQAMRSYALAAPHPSPPSGMYISLDERPRSIRPTWIDGRPAVVVGGEGHVVGELGDRSAPERWAALEAYARDLGAEPAAFRWVAHDLIPSDGVPFIGRIAPALERTWVASGFQKWGISTAMVAADLILGEIQGSSRAWGPLFDPRRVVDSLTVSLAKDAVRSVRHLVGDRVGELLHPDEARSPKCTHLGCALSLDATEQTWDCPCHGSRYDLEGQVICGPAVTPVDVSGAS